MQETRAPGAAAELELSELPEGNERRLLLTRLGLIFQTSFQDISRLTHMLPAELTLRLSQAERDTLVSELERAGAAFELRQATGPVVPCPAHGKLGANASCAKCSASGCALCIPSDLPLCSRCRAKQLRSRRFFLARVSALLLVFVVILLWGLGDLLSRRARNSWERPVNVAVILVARDPIEAETIELLRRRLPSLEAILRREAIRHGVRVRPFQFVFYGPTLVNASPTPPSEEGLWPLVEHTYRQWRYVRRIDRALDIDTSAWDSRVYLIARKPHDQRVQFVEGYGQAGGRIGVVEVELTPAMVDVVLSVGAHELFHTLGASDKYGPRGDTLVPEGLVEPGRVPRYPQPQIEIMTRGRPLDAQGKVAQLETLEELGVGPMTAREIGWLPAGD